MSIEEAAVIDVHTHPTLAVTDLAEAISLAERLGIGGMVLLGDVLGRGYDPSPEDIRAINDNTLGLARRHAAFCRGFCFLNPLNPEEFTLGELDRCVALGAVEAMGLPRLRIVALCPYFAEAVQLAAVENVFVDICFAETLDTLRQLRRKAAAEKILFGSRNAAELFGII